MRTNDLHWQQPKHTKTRIAAFLLTFLNRLAQVLRRRMTAVAVIEAHVVWIHFVNVQVAVGVVVAVRLVVLAISQPPIAAVGSLPRPLLRHTTLHGILRATATAVRGTSHVHNQVRLPRVVVYVLAQRVVYGGPVLLVARSPNLVARRTRILFTKLLHPEAVADADYFAG